MKSLSAHRVVEQMTSELAARRRMPASRRTAYLTLARVILQGEEQRDRRGSPEIRESPRCNRESAAAA